MVLFWSPPTKNGSTRYIPQMDANFFCLLVLETRSIRALVCGPENGNKKDTKKLTVGLLLQTPPHDKVIAYIKEKEKTSRPCWLKSWASKSTANVFKIVSVFLTYVALKTSHMAEHMREAGDGRAENQYYDGAWNLIPDPTHSLTKSLTSRFHIFQLHLTIFFSGWSLLSCHHVTSVRSVGEVSIPCSFRRSIPAM